MEDLTLQLDMLPNSYFLKQILQTFIYEILWLPINICFYNTSVDGRSATI